MSIEEHIERDIPVPSTPDEYSTEYWIERIKSGWQKAAESIIQVGRDLIALRAKHSGQWTFHQTITQRLPFDVRTAQRLIKIAENPVLTDATHVSRLPPSWGTLYELATKLPPHVLKAKLADGSITPKLERKDVRALNPQSKPVRSNQPSPMERIKIEKADLEFKVAGLRERLATAEKNADGANFTSMDTDKDIAGVITRILSKEKFERVIKAARDIYKNQSKGQN
jgi:hypothetical protein